MLGSGVKGYSRVFEIARGVLGGDGTRRDPPPLPATGKVAKLIQQIFVPGKVPILETQKNLNAQECEISRPPSRFYFLLLF